MGMGLTPIPIFNRKRGNQCYIIQKEDLLELGAEITTREIYQQPDVWKEAFESYQAKT